MTYNLCFVNLVFYCYVFVDDDISSGSEVIPFTHFGEDFVADVDSGLLAFVLSILLGAVVLDCLFV